jgi:hypothetical protein
MICGAILIPNFLIPNYSNNCTKRITNFPKKKRPRKRDGHDERPPVNRNVPQNPPTCWINIFFCDKTPGTLRRCGGTNKSQQQRLAWRLVTVREYDLENRKRTLQNQPEKQCGGSDRLKRRVRVMIAPQADKHNRKRKPQRLRWQQIPLSLSPLSDWG